MTELSRRDVIKRSIVGVVGFITGVLFSSKEVGAKILKEITNNLPYKPDFTTTPQMLGYTTRLEIPPIGGWEQDTYYIIDAAFSVHNPIHRRIFYTGFSKYGKSNAFNFVVSPEDLVIEQHLFCNNDQDISNWYYIKAIYEINLNSTQGFNV